MSAVETGDDLRRVGAELRLLERQARSSRDEAVDAARAAELSRDQCVAALKNVQGAEREAAVARAADLDKFRSEMQAHSQKLSLLIRDIHEEKKQALSFERELEARLDANQSASQRQQRADFASEKRDRERADDRIEQQVVDNREALLQEIAVLRDRVDGHREAITAAGRRARGHLKLYADGSLVGEAQNLDFVGATVTKTGDRAVVDHSGTYVPQDLSTLTASSSPDTDDLVYVWLDGAARKVTLADIQTLIGGGGGGTVDVVSNVAQDRILGRVTAGSGDSEELTAAQVKPLLALVKGDVGLANVDNTSDANKPVSTATQTALDAKVPLDLSALTASTAPDADDLVYIWLDGAARKVALSDLVAFMLANPTLTGTVTVPDGALAIADTSGLQAALDAKLASASYTAADVLSKLITVDGAGSGLDADLLDGNSSAFYAADSAVVHDTGDETIAGTKTFSTAVRGTRDYTDVPSGVVRFGRVTVSGRGTGTVSDRWTGWASEVSDGSGVVGDKAVSGAANNGSGLIRLTVTGHGITNGDGVAVWGVGGTTEANGVWTATVIDANTIDLVGSTFTNAYTSGGTVTNRPMLYGLSAVVAPSVARGGITGAAANGDDVNAVVAYNNGTAKATEAFYVGDNPSITGDQWLSQFTANAEGDIGFLVGNTGDVDKGFAVGGAIKASGYGLDLYAGASAAASWGAGAVAVRVPNARAVVGRNAAGSADVDLLELNASDVLEIGAATAYIDTVNGRFALGLTPDLTNGRLQVLAISGSATPARFEGADAQSCQVEFHAYAGNPQFLGKRAEGTRASKSAVTTDLILARLGGLGYHSGSAYGTTSAALDLMSGEGFTSTAQGAYIKASLKQVGANTLTEAFRIKWASGATRRMTMNGAFDFELDATTGTKFGTAITEKMGFYGVTPITQRAGAAQAAVATTGATNVTPFGYTTAAQADAIVTLVNELRAWAVAQGFIKGAA